MAMKVTERQQDVLDVLRREDGQASQELLAAHLGTTFLALRRMLNTLEDLGLIRIYEGHSRTPCSGGGKYVLAELVKQSPPAEGGESR